MIKISIISLIFLMALPQMANSIEYRDKLDFPNVFSASSEVTAVFVTCANENRIKIALQSFLAHFTYPLKQIVLSDCYDLKFTSAIPKQYANHPQTFRFQKFGGIESMINALHDILKTVNTPYIYLSDTQWKTQKLQNFIQESINIFQYCQKIKRNCYQITPNYPYWRIAARLTQLEWTDSGEAFHQIVGLTPQYQYFTISPSMIHLSTFKDILSKVMDENKCNQANLGIKDLCLIKEISKKVEENKLQQIYINDGTGKPYSTVING